MEAPGLSSQVSGEPLTPHGVNESLEGLLGAFEHLKSTLGYGDELAAVEQHLLTLRSENEELRQFAEEAIRVRCGARGALAPPCEPARRA